MGRRTDIALDEGLILDTAREIVVRDGADALGINRVARALGVRPASLYNHVANGEALAQGLTHRGYAELADALGEVPAAEGAAYLSTLCRAMWTWMRDNHALYTVMVRVPPDNGHSAFADTLRRTLALFDAPLAALEVAEADRVHAVRALRSAVHGFAELDASGQFRLQARPEDSFDRMIDALLRGFATA